ncbi:MAG: thiamine phosphate synthase [Planctomycetota bacterium]|nr:MAG: thiamine phosphate synthase [Planctomycetota bacterium]
MVFSTSALRMIDANANRAAEGLRTIEDYARLVVEDAVAARWAKELRHRLTCALSSVPRPQRLAARSTERDAGTGIHTASELARSELSSLIPAAAERVQQALRTLEEVTKSGSAQTALEIKNLRYTAYDVLARIELRLQTDARRLRRAHLCVLIDGSRPIDDFRQYVRALADAGVDLVQLRDKNQDGRSLVEYGRAAVDALRGTDAELIVNDRVDVALCCQARGVHLGQEDISIGDARRLAGPEMWIGISTHSVEQALAAQEAGADYIGCGPTFPSATKQFDSFPGLPLLQAVSQCIEIPWLAIGGITMGNLEQVIAAGCRQIAVSQCVHGAADPIVTVGSLKRRLVEAAERAARQEESPPGAAADSVQQS